MVKLEKKRPNIRKRETKIRISLSLFEKSYNFIMLLMKIVNRNSKKFDKLIKNRSSVYIVYILSTCGGFDKIFLLEN